MQGCIGGKFLSQTQMSNSDLFCFIMVYQLTLSLDDGSTKSHVSDYVAYRLNFEIFSEEKSIGLAIKGHTSNSIGKCEAKIELNYRGYANICLSLLQTYLKDMVLCQDFTQQHKYPFLW